MARKRYETAFIPSTTSGSHYPDVDSLLFSIESISFERGSRREGRGERSEEGSTLPHRWRSRSVNPDKFLTKVGSSISSSAYQRVTRYGSSEDASVLDKGQGRIRSPNYFQLETIGGQSRSDSPVRKMPISLSEPLRPKHSLQNKSYVSIQSSSGCSTTNSSSPVPTEPKRKSGRESQTTFSRRSRLTLVKPNSASSLDSIDSGSEDLKCLEKGLDGGLRGGSKLLSPISDKSPIEPTTSHVPNMKDGTDDSRARSSAVNSWKKQNLLTAAEQLTNLPWEMPKLKRKLALLVDSGISLDDQGSREGERQRWIAKDNPITAKKYETSPSKSQPYFKDIEIGEDLVLHGQVEMEKLKENMESGIGDSPPRTEVPPIPSLKPDRCKMKLDFGEFSSRKSRASELIDVKVDLEAQDWFHGAITRVEAEDILRSTREGTFLVRNCESSVYNRYSLSLK